MAKNKMDNEIFTYEYTDLFGGERNYAWVRQGHVAAKNRKEAMKKARERIGLTGVKGEYREIGDGAEWKPYGMCVVLSVDCGSEQEVENVRVR